MRHHIQTVDQAQHYLADNAPSPRDSLYFAAFDVPDFWTCPASLKKHHCFPGGLAVHTAQVLVGAINFLRSMECVDFDSYECVHIACVWHDVAKTIDYKGGVYTDHYKYCGHLVKSAMMLRDKATELKYDPTKTDRIVYLMLAHHGRREWGSPVEPKDAESWAIHASDMLSAQYIEA